MQFAPGFTNYGAPPGPWIRSGTSGGEEGRTTLSFKLGLGEGCCFLGWRRQEQVAGGGGHVGTCYLGGSSETANEGIRWPVGPTCVEVGERDLDWRGKRG